MAGLNANWVRWVVAASTVALFYAFAVSSAQAVTTIHHSLRENSYGWCVRGSLSAATECSLDWCRKGGGTECVRVLECDGGWGAVARSWNPTNGLSATCGWKDAFTARVMALASCMAGANDVCWNQSVFDSRRALSTESNLDFDRTLFVQVMLQMLDLELGTADGEAGPKTINAIEAFEADLGYTPTGVIDDKLFQSALAAIAGSQNLARKMAEFLLTANPSPDLVYVHPGNRAPNRTYTELLLAMPPDWQRFATAILVASGSDNKCLWPARSAELVGDVEEQVWKVVCEDAAYMLILVGDGSSVLLAPWRDEFAEKPGAPAEAMAEEEKKR